VSSARWAGVQGGGAGEAVGASVGCGVAAVAAALSCGAPEHAASANANRRQSGGVEPLPRAANDFTMSLNVVDHHFGNVGAMRIQDAHGKW